MTSVAEARAAMLAAARALPGEAVALEQALGRTLAAPVRALRAQPPFAASAMDGYALRAADTPGVLRIVGESAAGHAFTGVLRAGEAARISTGAPIPLGADAVLIQEDARVEGDQLHSGAVAPGRHLRDAGVDFAADEIVLEAGRELDPIAMALAAAAGAAGVEVVRRPRVTILCAGDEIAPPGTTLRDDQIFESCSYAVAGMATQWGAFATRIGALPDVPAAIARAAEETLRTSDLVVFIGSASVGPHDHARSAFESLGARIVVSKVDMRPGKPTWFATTPLAPVLGLPGNPASAIVAAVLFLKPLLERMLGRSGELVFRRARLAKALPENGPREAYLRARTKELDSEIWIEAAAEQDSSLLSVLAGANALLVRSARAPPARQGDDSEFVPLFL
jgi:molybdopterin molybdotransferase